MRASERIETDRLVMRRPVAADADAIFARYASDPEVTRFLSWPRHNVIDDSRAFIRFSDAEWEKWSAGPYLIESRAGVLLGSTGLSFETPERVATGYVLAKDAWGRGYATEALDAVVALASDLAVRRLYALCHPEHERSQRVLLKCGFVCEGMLYRHAERGGPIFRDTRISGLLCS